MYDPEVVYQDADIEQAQYEMEGNALARRQRHVETLKRAGADAEATEICAHGYVGKLDGLCSKDDPRYGEEGFRCYDCGAVIDEIDGQVIHVK